MYFNDKSKSRLTRLDTLTGTYISWQFLQLRKKLLNCFHNEAPLGLRLNPVLPLCVIDLGQAFLLCYPLLLVFISPVGYLSFLIIRQMSILADCRQSQRFHGCGGGCHRRCRSDTRSDVINKYGKNIR